MKKKILYFILGALTFTGIAYAAPSVIYQRHIRPESDNAWDLGASSSTWKGVFTGLASTTNLTVSGLGNTGTECLQINNQGVVDNSGSGCGGGGGGAGFGNTWQLLTNDLNTITPTTTTIGIQVNASSTIDRLFARFATTSQATTTNFSITSITSALPLTQADGSLIEYAGTSCTNQFFRSLSALGAATCATVVAGDVDLADLTATDGTLTFSGAYDGQTARTIGLNLGNANTWTASQSFDAGATIGNAITDTLTVTATSTFASGGATFSGAGVSITGGGFSVTNGVTLGTTTQNNFQLSGNANIQGAGTSTFTNGINLTTGCIRYGTATTTIVDGYCLTNFRDSSSIYASSTLDYDGDFGTTGTTTYNLANYRGAVDLISIYCKTNKGTMTVQIGTGVASSTVVCTTSGAEVNPNLYFAPRSDYKISIGTQTGSADLVTITDSIIPR